MLFCSSIVLQQSLVFVSGNLPVKPYSYLVLPQFTDDSLFWDRHNDQEKNVPYQSYLSRHYLPIERSNL